MVAFENLRLEKYLVVFKKVISWLGKDTQTKKSDPQPEQQQQAASPVPTQSFDGATTVPRNQHAISRKQISPSALKVLYRLKDNGYEAYLVGGCIRDLLLGLEPKDFDVVTNATPEQVKRCFNNCRLIGRRFRLAHVMFGREIIEVATFRGHHDAQQDNPEEETTPKELAKKVSRASGEGQLLRDNVYGSIHEDAERRDFTVNALYYSINDFSIHDFANGLEDIEKGVIDLIGDPETRYREDPVRMLRAIRFATKLQMTIAPRTESPIYELAHLLRNIPPARLFDESLKLFLAGKAADNADMLRKFGLFRYFFPVVDQVLTGNPEDKEELMLSQMFKNTDERINSGKSVSPAFILAAMMWYPLEAHANELALEGGLHPYDAFQIASNDVVQRMVQTVAIPKRFSAIMREIWQFQHRLTKTQGRRPLQLIENPRFRAAYDFLVLRAQAEGGELVELADWWTEFQHSDDAKQAAIKASKNRHKTATNGPQSTTEKPGKKGPYKKRRRRTKPKNSDAPKS